jgi:tetratricopeptide (TPR) repeat protein
MASESDHQALLSQAQSAFSRNRYEEALACYDRLLAHRPRDADVLIQRANTLGALGRPIEAISSLERAGDERPRDAALQYGIAHALQRQGQYEKALSRFDRVLKLAPGHADAWNNKGVTLFALGRQEEGIASVERAVSLNPGDARARYNLANARLLVGNIAGAQVDLDAVLRLEPNNLQARLGLGRCMNALGRFGEALPHYDGVLGSNPHNADAIQGLAEALSKLNRQDEFVSRCRLLLHKTPSATAAWLELGIATARLHGLEAAEESFQRAIALEPNNASLHARIGWLYVELGRSDKAQVAFRTACAIQPQTPEFWRSLVRVTKVVRGDGILEHLEGVLQSGGTASTELHFALAKALADVGENNRAFQHVFLGNKARRARIRYDERMVLTRMSQIAETFSPAIARRFEGLGDQSRVPIFVLGMPRTGSTLVEQVLAAHREVVSLGELGAFEQAIFQLSAAKGVEFPSCLSTLESHDVLTLAHDYLTRLNGAAGQLSAPAARKDRTRIVDKSPTNFCYVGLIRAALPYARIIHTRRDPIDTCLSCFENLFDGDGLPYSYDLGELGRYHRHYEKLMTAWGVVLPKDSFLTVDYASLVGDFETEVRRILAYCNLAWDQACLSFHEVERPVRTASASQVRQPLYSTSIKKWRPSDHVLEPLLRALSEPL